MTSQILKKITEIFIKRFPLIKIMNKWLEILLGLILIIVPIVLVLPGMWLASWGVATIEFIKGGIVVFVIFVGLLFLLLGISDLRE